MQLTLITLLYRTVSLGSKARRLSLSIIKRHLFFLFQVLASSRFKARTWSTKSARFISTKSTTKWWVHSGLQNPFAERRDHPILLLLFLSLPLVPPSPPPGHRGGIKQYLPSALRLRIRRRAELIFRIIEKGCRGYLHLTCTHATYTHADDVHTRAREHAATTTVERVRIAHWKTKSGFSKAHHSRDHTGPTVIDSSVCRLPAAKYRWRRSRI